MTRKIIATRDATRTLRRALLAAALLATALVPTTAASQSTGEAVEYHHAGFGHYFITARPGEIAILDAGAFGGAWRRTGESFLVWTAGGPSTREACRFFTEAYAPKSSHFYTALSAECANLQRGATWQFEDIAFHLKVDALGNCPDGSSPLYRLYNNAQSGAPNHRYTTLRAIFDQMSGQGWTAEGAGALTVFACVPSAVGGAVPSGWFEGRTSAGEELLGPVFDDGSFYLFYSSDQSLGLVEGRATFTGNAFSAPRARDYAVKPVWSEQATAVNGTVVPRTSIEGSIAGGGRTRTFTARYEKATSTPVPLAQAAGSFLGFVGTPADLVLTSLTLSPAGHLSGSFAGCAVAGTLAPRQASGFMEASISFGAGCPPGQDTTSGIAFYSPDNGGELFVATHGADGTGLFAFVGQR
jgi:hypothetical protein